MAKSPRKHTLCTPLSIDQLLIFGIFEHKWGTRKHINDLKKYSRCMPVQKEIKPKIWGDAITPGPWNRQQCWFIFEDPNVRVARLLESLATIRLSSFLFKKCCVAFYRTCMNFNSPWMWYLCEEMSIQMYYIPLWYKTTDIFCALMKETFELYSCIVEAIHFYSKIKCKKIKSSNPKFAFVVIHIIM